MPQNSPPAPTELTIPIQNTSFNQRYLYAFATKGEVLNHIRTQTIEEEKARLPQIIADWEAQQPTVQMLIQQEAGHANATQIASIPNEHEAVLQAIRNDELFKKSFSFLPWEFAMVDVDTLVAPQRTVNLDYIEELRIRYQGHTTNADLINICLSPKREMPPIRHLEVLNNSHVFSSKNQDLRFLGAFLKKLTPDDYQHAELGGIPAAAIIAFIGYGSSPVNVLRCDNRLVLNNGFHRVYALRSMGINRLPMVVQQITNFQLEFPPQIVGLPREYLIGAPRPVLMKDFFRDDFCISLKAKMRVKVVTLQTGLGQFDVPS